MLPCFCDYGKTPAIGVAVYGDHIPQLRGPRSDNTGELALRLHYVIVCLTEGDHTPVAARGGGCHWSVGNLLSAPGPLDGLAARCWLQVSVAQARSCNGDHPSIAPAGVR